MNKVQVIMYDGTVTQMPRDKAEQYLKSGDIIKVSEIKKYHYAYQCKEENCEFPWLSNDIVGVECPKCKSKNYKKGHNRFGHDVGPMGVM